MKKTCFIVALLWAAQWSVAEVSSSVNLPYYYATANGKSGNELRLALYEVIKGHNSLGYKNIAPIMQWSDTKDADGEHILDIYTNCEFSAPITSWSNSSSVGGGMNREHTVPQSWFSEDEPMRSDVFHVYPTDCKANGNRSSFLYGECANGSSSSSAKCSETGKKGTSDWTAGSSSYTYNGQTFVATTSYTGTVYEPIDEYKGDLARSYFYMATRYASGEGTLNCENWSGGAFGTDLNGLGAYTAEILLKWHRLDPVSEKELIRNEVIYGNPEYNKSTSKQGNRNPFIDYPELVEYIWGDMQEVPVIISALVTTYNNPFEALDNTNAGGKIRKVLRDNQLYLQIDDRWFTVTGQRVQ